MAGFKFRSYGKLVMDAKPANHLRLESVLGGAAIWPTGDQGHKPNGATLHLQTKEGLLRLDMSWQDAATLWSVLQCMKLDYGLDAPDDPRGEKRAKPDGGSH